MSTGKKLLKGSFLRMSNFFIQVLVTLAITPLIVHSLGDRMYGFWGIVGAFLGYYALLDFGLTSAVSRFVSKALGNNDEDEMNTVLSTTFVLFSYVGVAALVLTMIAVVVCPYFITDPNEVTLFRKIIALLGFSTAIGFPMRIFGAVLISFLRFDLLTYATFVRVLVVNLLIYILLNQGHGILSVAVIAFSGTLLEYGCTYVFARKTFQRMTISLAKYKRERISLFFDYSSKTFIGQLADIVRFRLDSIIIASFLNLSLVTYYVIGQRLIDYFSQFVMSSVGIMGPLFSQYEGRGDFDSIRKRFLEGVKFSTIISIYIGISLIFYGKEFIQRWMGPGFESSYYVTLILCIPYILAHMQHPTIGLLQGISKHQYFMYANIGEGILNLILSLILIKPYGIYGVALGTACSMSLFKLFVQPVYVCRVINLSIFDYYVKTLLFTVLKTGIPLIVFFAVAKQFIKPEFSILIISAILQMLLFIPVVYYFLLNTSDRDMFKTAISRRVQV